MISARVADVATALKTAEVVARPGQAKTGLVRPAGGWRPGAECRVLVPGGLAWLTTRPAAGGTAMMLW
jgi:hypothetical protein